MILQIWIKPAINLAMFLIPERAQQCKGLTEECYGFMKSRKRSIFVIDSYLNDSAFTTVKLGVIGA